METPNNTDFNIKFTHEKVEKSVQWFKLKILELKSSNKIPRNVDSDKLLKNLDTPKTFEVGKLYLFHYNPKTKEKLPYYDTFPIVMITKIVKGGFYGINFHYLPVVDRLKLMSILLEKSASKEKNGDLDRLLISYEMLNNSGNFYIAYKPCFKRYLLDFVKSEIKIIETNEWAITLSLPIETFKKKKKEEVWQESKKIINDL